MGGKRVKRGDARLEFCLLVCELVVDRTLDLTRLLQELSTELRRIDDVIVTISSIIPSGCMTHCRVSSVDRFLEADSGDEFNIYPALSGCDSRRTHPAQLMSEAVREILGWVEPQPVGQGWKVKIALPSVTIGNCWVILSLAPTSPQGPRRLSWAESSSWSPP